jgi:signal transduction histidine kinase
LLVEVADDGLGFAPATASGLGLSNLRERLAALYDGRAGLTIEDAQPGTRVRVALPLTL